MLDLIQEAHERIKTKSETTKSSRASLIADLETLPGVLVTQGPNCIEIYMSKPFKGKRRVYTEIREIHVCIFEDNAVNINYGREMSYEEARNKLSEMIARFYWHD